MSSYFITYFTLFCFIFGMVLAAALEDVGSVLELFLQWGEF
jgi:hypothetical protein|tara:strand:+ start:1534 stop:1656 length:123 start_codon:yes stop_codon:yes gene_type:complete